MKINVLITGAGGTLAQTIMKALRLSDLKCRIVTTNCYFWGAGLYRSAKGFVVPEANEPNYIDAILAICKKEKIDVVFVGTDYEITKLAKSKSLIEKETGAKVIVSSPEVVEIGNDKWKTYKFLKDNNLTFPRTALVSQPKKMQKLIKEVGFPLIAKPRVSSGAKGLFLVKNKQELDFVAAIRKDMLIQEYLQPEDEEYTVGIFTSKDFEILGAICMKRYLLFGITHWAEIGRYEEVTREAKKLVMKLKPVGPCNVQLCLTDKGPVTFEINPRFSSTTGVRAKFGFNGPAAAIRHFVLNEKVDLSNYSEGAFVRYWDEVYIPKKEFELVRKQKKIQGSKSEILPLF